MPEPVRAIEYIRHQGGGGSDPHLLRGSDGLAYVVKFRGNPQEPSATSGQILANEFVSNGIGKLIGAPCPDVIAIDVSESFMQAAGIAYPRGRPPAGLQFGSRYVADSSGTAFQSPTPEHIRQFKNLNQVPSMIILDSLCNNEDRKIEHVVFHGITGGFKFWAVDYGHTLGVARGWQSLIGSSTDSALVAPVLSETVRSREDLDNAVERVERELTEANIDALLAQLPAVEWGIDESARQNLKNFLTQQRSSIRARVLSHLGQFPNLGRE